MFVIPDQAKKTLNLRGIFWSRSLLISYTFDESTEIPSLVTKWPRSAILFKQNSCFLNFATIPYALKLLKPSVNAQHAPNCS